MARGHSRIPVYKDSRQDVVGVLLVKKLITLDPNNNTPISEIEGALIPPPSCATVTALYDILNQFQTGRSKWTYFYTSIMNLAYVSVLCLYMVYTGKSFF